MIDRGGRPWFAGAEAGRGSCGPGLVQDLTHRHGAGVGQRDHVVELGGGDGDPTVAQAQLDPDDAVGGRGSAAKLALGEHIEVEDTATIVLDHAGGVRSTFFATNAHHRNDDVELRIDGEAGSLQLVDGRAEFVTASDVQVLAVDAQADGSRSYWGRGHAALIADFHASLARPEPFWLGREEGIAPLRLLREVYRQSGLLPSDQPV